MSIRDDFFAAQAKASLWDVAVSIKRGNPLPLDANSVFKAYGTVGGEDYAGSLLEYATSNPVAYPGQICAVVGADATTIYYLDQNLAIQPVGIIPAGDNKTVDVSATGVITLKGAATATAGQQPRIVNKGTAEAPQLELEWYTPDNSTVAGLQDTVGGLVETINGVDGDENKPGLVADVNALKLADIELAADIKTITDDYVKAEDIAEFETKAKVKEVADALANYKTSNDAALAGVKTTADAAQGDVDALETYVGTIPSDATATNVVAYVQEKTAGIASEGALTELGNRVSTVEGKVATIEGDYLKAADKTELSNAIAAEKERAEGAEAGLQNQINIIMNNPDTEGVINSIEEFTQYIADHGEIAEGFRTDIDKNKEDIAANAQAIADQAASDAATFETKADANAFKETTNAELAKKLDANGWMTFGDEAGAAFVYLTEELPDIPLAGLMVQPHDSGSAGVVMLTNCATENESAVQITSEGILRATSESSEEYAISYPAAPGTLALTEDIDKAIEEVEKTVASMGEDINTAVEEVENTVASMGRYRGNFKNLDDIDVENPQVGDIVGIKSGRSTYMYVPYEWEDGFGAWHLVASTRELNDAVYEAKEYADAQIDAAETTIAANIATAKQEAIDAAATDATTKADKALADAKADTVEQLKSYYTSTQIDNKFDTIDIELDTKQDKAPEGKTYAYTSDIDAAVDSLKNTEIKNAQDTANAANTTANTANAQASENKTAIEGINTTITGHTTKIGENTDAIAALQQADIDHHALYEALLGTVGGHGTEIAGLKTSKADQSALEAAVSRVAANEQAITTINETTIPAVDDKVEAIKADYLKTADKTELSNAIKAITDDYLKTADKTELAAAIKAIADDYLKATDKAELVEDIGEVATRVTTAEGDIDALQETIKGLSGAMHFKGVVTSDPAAEDFVTTEYAIGDVVIFGNKEYVLVEVDVVVGDETVKSNRFVEFGDATGNASAISDLNERVEALEEVDHTAAHATTLQGAKDYADSLANNYATAEQGGKADSAVQEVTCATNMGIKATRTGNNILLDWDDTITLVLCGGDAGVISET